MPADGPEEPISRAEAAVAYLQVQCVKVARSKAQFVLQRGKDAWIGKRLASEIGNGGERGDGHAKIHRHFDDFAFINFNGSCPQFMSEYRQGVSSMSPAGF